MTDRPWMTALEMQFAVQRLIRLVLRRQGREGEANSVFKATDLLGALTHAECYAWSAETAMAVTHAAATIPEETVFSSRALPARCGWWWFNRPMALGRNMVAALVWAPDAHDAGWWQVWVLTPRPDVVDHDVPIPTHLFRLCETVPLAAMDDARRRADTEEQRTEGIEAILTTRFILAACAWLRQRILITSVGHIERHRRKQLSREYQLPPPSDVKVIQLRRAESSPRLQCADTEPVEWSCRWIVSGHWRNQIYAQGEHKLIYVLPYVKGPADMPLRVPTHTVYQVSR